MVTFTVLLWNDIHTCIFTCQCQDRNYNVHVFAKNMNRSISSHSKTSMKWHRDSRPDAYISGLNWTFVPAGSFGKPGVETDQYVEWLREYCQVFFSGLSVKLLPTITVAEWGCSFRVNNNSPNLQLLTGKLVIAFAWLVFIAPYLLEVKCI